MKKFLILMSAGVAFAFASCSASKSSCCGACSGGECAKTECAACAKEGKTCAACAAKKN
ncbi:MAG: hypothetical protein QNL33_05845 [Akkermansiaceae bacterium]